ncbi:MAG: molybdenum cofactor guanylyltransferase [Spirochaetota bacterium]
MNVPLARMNAYIMAGGRSERFGRDKAFLTCGGRFFIDLAVETCAALFGAVYLVGRRHPGPLVAGCLEDRVRGIGPLGGMCTILEHTGRELCFVMGVDYPFADPAVIRYLGRTAAGMAGHQGLVPVMPDGAHPLFAFYRGTCLEAARSCVAQGCYRIDCIGRHTPLMRLHMSATGFHPRKLERCFVNINRREDYERLVLRGEVPCAGTSAPGAAPGKER